MSDVDYTSHSCAPECAEHPFSSGYDWSAAIRTVGAEQPLADPKPATEPLDPELTPYLDFPLYFHDDGISCNNPECRCYEDGPDFIWTGRRQTVREFLAQVKGHHEGKSPLDG